MGIEEDFIKSNLYSNRMYRRACKVMVDGITRNISFYRPFPVYIKKGKGSHIWDWDGNERIDYCFNHSSLILGHNHPKVLEAVKQQLEYGTVFGGPTEVEVKLAEKIVERLPSTEMIRFTPSGTEAVHQALRLARSYKGREKIVKFEGAYHGSWDAVDISNFPQRSKTGSTLCLNSIPHNEGVPDGVLENTLITPYNNAKAVEEIVKKHKFELAAFIIEPVQRGIIPKNDFLKEIREITEKHDILLVFDEVRTFRLSRGGAQEMYKITPDITVLGKSIGGGFPIGAYGASKEIMKAFSHSKACFPHLNRPRLAFSGSFNGHPISMAAGLATLEELKIQTYKYMNKLGQDLRTALTKKLNDLNIIAQVGGVGSLVKVFWTREDVVDYESSINGDPRISEYFSIDLLNRGIYMRGTPNVSAATTSKDIKITLQAIEQSLISLKPIIYKISPNILCQ